VLASGFPAIVVLVSSFCGEAVEFILSGYGDFNVFGVGGEVSYTFGSGIHNSLNT
jgi:hypothetical protein